MMKKGISAPKAVMEEAREEAALVKLNLAELHHQKLVFAVTGDCPEAAAS
jgi:hypothetical protein